MPRRTKQRRFFTEGRIPKEEPSNHCNEEHSNYVFKLLTAFKSFHLYFHLYRYLYLHFYRHPYLYLYLYLCSTFRTQPKAVTMYLFGTKIDLNNLMDLKLKNQANTNILNWGGKLLAYFEAGLPHR